MSKRKARKQTVSIAGRPGGNRRTLVIAGLVLSLIAASVSFARWSGSGLPTQKKNQNNQGAAITPSSFTPANPSKEYIYSGGRLIATEEPAAAPSCTYTLSSTNSTFTASGGSSSVNVIPLNGCTLPWTAVSIDPNWLTIQSGSSGSGSGTVNYSVTANTGSSGRSATLSIAQNTFTVTQSGSSCTYSLSPTFRSFTSAGGTDTVTVFADPGCSWASVSNDPWITITFSSNGPGNGTVNYSVANHTGQSSRTGTMTIAGRTFTVSQAAAGGPCTYAISPSSQSFSASGGSGTINVTAGTGCSWTPLTATSWITINAGWSGSGNGSISFTVAAFTGVLPRLGTIKVNGLVFTVTQSASSGGGGGGGNGLTGEYLNFNAFGNPLCATGALTRTDSQIDFDWGTGIPGAGIGVDFFLARWTGQVEAPETGTYTFSVRTDDGVRLWVNNQLIIDKWFNQYGNTWSNEIQLTAGQRYDIRMDMYEWDGGAEAHLWWRRPSMATTAREIIPTSRLFPYSPAAQPLYEGSLDVANCTTLSGWALNRRSPNTALNVSLYDGTNPTPLATVAANQFRSETVYCSGDNGLHGFNFTVPASLKDGQPHSIRVKIANTNVALSGTPVTLVCSGASAPPAPGNLTATTVSPSQINLVWQDNSTNENGFIIRRSIDGGSYSDLVTINSPNVTTHSDTGLSSGHTYCYKVAAFNNSGQSTESSPACAAIEGTSQGPPVAPTGLAAAFISSPRKIDLVWSDNSNNEASVQVLRRYRKFATATWSPLQSLGYLPANTTTYSDASALSSGYTYAYVVRAWNELGASGYSNEAQVTIPTGSSPTCSAVNAFSGSGGTGGYSEGAGANAQWRSPSAGATAVDPVSGLNALFVTDTENHSIRMIYLEGPAKGNSILIAGSGVAGYSDGDGDPYQARFNYPQGIAAIKNQSGVVEALLVADTDNQVIRKLLAPTGKNRWRVTYFSGSQGKSGYVDNEPLDTKFNSPHGIAIGLNGLIYVADTNNNAIRLLNSEGYSATWYQPASTPSSFQPIGIAMNEFTGEIYIGDQGNHKIYAVTEGVLITLAGTGSPGYSDGVGTAAVFNTPYNLAWSDSESGGAIYIADLNNNRVRVLDLKTGAVTTWAGSGTLGYVNSNCSSSQFNLPSGLAIGPVNELYVIEKGNNSIRKVQ
jgi:hypothetical protein